MPWLKVYLTLSVGSLQTQPTAMKSEEPPSSETPLNASRQNPSPLFVIG
ncbi:MAG: hypothetical protein HQL52_04270 [Magnetococcales bacterium]|nr:hypothetical protein [Magnetococcales bacterium]